MYEVTATRWTDPKKAQYLCYGPFEDRGKAELVVSMLTSQQPHTQYARIREVAESGRLSVRVENCLRAGIEILVDGEVAAVASLGNDLFGGLQLHFTMPTTSIVPATANSVIYAEPVPPKVRV